jgi:hypothetical protein
VWHSPLFYCSPDSSTRYLLVVVVVVSECELGRLFCYLRGSYNFARISWLFSLCVSRLTTCWHHLPHILSWVWLQGTSQLTTNKQTNNLFLWWGQRLQLHDANDSCRFVNNDKTMTSFSCCRSATTPTFAKRFTLL